MKKQYINILSNTAQLLGSPVHEKYPPSFVLQISKKSPFLQLKRGIQYYEELIKRRRK